jgi:hypothetical protein
MPIEVNELEAGKQVVVSCQGDIAVQPFFPEVCDGVAWMLLAQGPPGEPGRNINGEVDEGPRLLGEQAGVLIGAKDYRSLDVLIKVLTALRDRLRDGPPVVMGADFEQEVVDAMMEKTARDIDKHIVGDMMEAAGFCPEDVGPEIPLCPHCFEPLPKPEDNGTFTIKEPRVIRTPVYAAPFEDDPPVTAGVQVWEVDPMDLDDAAVKGSGLLTRSEVPYDPSDGDGTGEWEGAPDDD